MEKTRAIENYTPIIEARAQHVFDVMRPRCTDMDMHRMQEAFRLAREAHSEQKRKTGEPYILHPIAVATIAAEELNLDANSVCAAFLHDVVEDTDIKLERITKQFGSDVSFLVKVLTKVKREKYEMSKQLDNFKQLLNAVQHDIRPILVKLADRLHNMRTLSSMRADKQMKIAGETDYFYAPLATRLGLYEVKTELENLSLRFRVPHEYEHLKDKIKADEIANRPRLESFMRQVSGILHQQDIEVKVKTTYRQPYSLWRKMKKYGDDFDHLKYRHFVEIEFETPEGISEKDMVLRIYSHLTDRFREKPGGILNYVDSPKENGYQSFHIKLLTDYGKWEEVHISSSRMVHNSNYGTFSEQPEENIRKWIAKFRKNLKSISHQGNDGDDFIENVVASFYNDDIMTFTPQGKPVVLPQRSSVIDFAYEIHTELGNKAKYARINGRLASMKTLLRRGDIIEIFTDKDSHPQDDWLEHAVSFKAKKAITQYLKNRKKPRYCHCTVCKPLPGEEVIGYKEENGNITVHKRDCPVAIRLASKMGDNIESVDYRADDTLYPVEFEILCIDRAHMIIDLVECISNKLNLSISSINTHTEDSIVTLTLTLGVHSYEELQTIVAHIREIPDVDEVQVKAL
ncbi:MAG: HD domain-containing protein [Clostridium sp.]|nr:HD domain-containing protein [Prevotella sp.]MCM1429649.1 HD domain-containing protein [Clostridium sp.]MCM1474651.1 HD domain-containing protein [Muribaculaceae bacterium]